MKKALRDAWCEALESGKYKQGKDVLRNGDMYCALGVLACVSGATWVPDKSIGGGVMLPVPPIREIRGDIQSRHVDRVTKMNDSDHSFAEIAAWIRENVPCESE